MSISHTLLLINTALQRHIKHYSSIATEKSRQKLMHESILLVQKSLLNMYLMVLRHLYTVMR